MVPKLILSFLVGGTWVALSTWIAERYGTKIGGLAAGLPSTILVSLFFIGWTHSPQTASQAAAVTPMVGAVNTVFLIIYIALVRRGFLLALSASLSFWSAAAAALVLLDFNSFGWSLLVYVLLIPLCYIIIEKLIKTKSLGAQPHAASLAASFRVILARAAFSGTVIALAVLAAHWSGPLLGGIISMFPALFLSTLVITYFAHGPSFSSAVMKAALFGGISVVLYGVLVRYAYPALGLGWGTLVCMAISFSAACIIHTLIIKRLT